MILRFLLIFYGELDFMKFVCAFLVNILFSNDQRVLHRKGFQNNSLLQGLSISFFYNFTENRRLSLIAPEAVVFLP